MVVFIQAAISPPILAERTQLLAIRTILGSKLSLDFWHEPGALNARGAQRTEVAADRYRCGHCFRELEVMWQRRKAARWRQGRLRPGQAIEYEEVSNRGKTSAENLKVQR
jgi:hypothetical protein